MFLVLGKEELGYLGDVARAVKEWTDLKFVVTAHGKSFDIVLDATLSMIDSKTRGLLSGTTALVERVSHWNRSSQSTGQSLKLKLVTTGSRILREL